jgi:hypothetical protein
MPRMSTAVTPSLRTAEQPATDESTNNAKNRITDNLTGAIARHYELCKKAGDKTNVDPAQKSHLDGTPITFRVTATCHGPMLAVLVRKGAPLQIAAQIEAAGLRATPPGACSSLSRRRC